MWLAVGVISGVAAFGFASKGLWNTQLYDIQTQEINSLETRLRDNENCRKTGNTASVCSMVSKGKPSELVGRIAELEPQMKNTRSSLYAWFGAMFVSLFAFFYSMQKERKIKNELEVAKTAVPVLDNLKKIITDYKRECKSKDGDESLSCMNSLAQVLSDMPGVKELQDAGKKGDQQ